jgi:DNA-binding NarL/FixJ family response regulator
MNRQPTRRDWTSEEDDLLREMARSGESVADISARLDRSPGSVRKRASKFKIALAKAPKLKL